MEAYKGIIIEESLENKDVLNRVKIVKTDVEQVTPEHKTPWVKQWTLHTVEIPEEEIDHIAKEISTALDSQHNWYADFKTDKIHYIVYRNKVSKINRGSKEEYDKATQYGISIGIPEYQVDFSPEVKVWKRNPEEKELIEKLKLEGYDKVYSWEDGPHEEDTYHTHEFDTKLVVLKGEIEIEMNNQKILLKQGESVEIPRKKVHTAITGSKGCKYIVAERH